MASENTHTYLSKSHHRVAFTDINPTKMHWYGYNNAIHIPLSDSEKS